MEYLAGDAKDADEWMRRARDRRVVRGIYDATDSDAVVLVGNREQRTQPPLGPRSHLTGGESDDTATHRPSTTQDTAGNALPELREAVPEEP